MRSNHVLILSTLLASGLQIAAAAGTADTAGTAGTAEVPLDLSLPPEAHTPFMPRRFVANPQHLSWCAQQSVVRRQDIPYYRTYESMATGCYDQASAITPESLLVNAALQLTVRGLSSAFSD